MDWKEACWKVGRVAKTGARFSAATVNRTSQAVGQRLDAAAPTCAPLAARWDAEADRRQKLRTPEHLKALMDAQRNHSSARSLASRAKTDRTKARKDSKNPLSTVRRSARTADKAARKDRLSAKEKLKEARKDYPATLNSIAVKAHAAHAVPASLASWALSSPADWAMWPAGMSAALIAANAAVLGIGRRTVTVAVDDGVSAEERHLMERLDPSYWVKNADGRGLSGTVTAPPEVTTAGVECAVRLDGQWTVKKLRGAADHVRALLGAPTDLPMLIAPGPRGGWGLIRLRTRSAAPNGAIPWELGDALGIDMTTGDDVGVELGHRMLIAGMSGSGKSTASRPLLADASEGPTNVLVIIDLKKVEGRLWDHRARVAHTPREVVELVLELVAELNERLDVLPKGQATLIPTEQRPRITVVVDEGAEVMSKCSSVEVITGHTGKGKPIKEKVDAVEELETIGRMGRAACIDLWWMTQSPTYGDGVSRQIAKQLGHRIGLSVESPSEARVVFGESAKEKGWKADELPMPGVALVRDGKRGPDEVKIRCMTDQQVIELPDQTIWHRGEHQEETAAEDSASVGRHLTLVKSTPTEAREETAGTAGLTDTETAVLDAIRTAGGPIRQKQVVETSGLAKGTVSKTVKRLIEAGHVAKADDGTLTATAGEVSA